MYMLLSLSYFILSLSVSLSLSLPPSLPPESCVRRRRKNDVWSLNSISRVFLRAGGEEKKMKNKKKKNTKSTKNKEYSSR